MLSLSFITGTEPDKWFQRFNDRHRGGLNPVASDDALASVLDGNADIALVRLPDARITDTLHVVKLYDEQPGIALPADHTLTLLEQVTESDIAAELIHYQGSADIPAIRQHLQVVAAGVGVVIAPRPLLKVLSGKQIAHRGFHGPDYEPTTIALVWEKTKDSDTIQDFVGIAKGRTPNSTRGSQTKQTARQKAKAKAARRAAAQPAKPKPKGKNRPRRR